MGGIRSRTSIPPSKVVKTVQKRVGRMTSVGEALCKATRIPIIEVGMSCKEVALSTKNIQEAYSANVAKNIKGIMSAKI